MQQKIPALVVSLIIAIYLANAIDRAFPAEPARGEPAPYGELITLTGTITREYDMAFVDSDQGPLSDPDKVARAVADYRRTHPADPSRLHEPIPHFILHLEKPLAVREGERDGLHPAEEAVSEIDLGSVAVDDKDLGKRRFQVTGKLWHANTVHHLRAIMMEVKSILRK